MTITNVNIQPIASHGKIQQVYFSHEGNKYVANLKVPGAVTDLESTLYLFGGEGDSCVKTREIENAPLLAEVVALVAAKS